jgi:hypothetical protein
MITKVGTSAVRTVISKKNQEVQSPHTPITTIKIEINVALKERKKKEYQRGY